MVWRLMAKWSLLRLWADGARSWVDGALTLLLMDGHGACAHGWTWSLVVYSHMQENSIEWHRSKCILVTLKGS